MALFENKLKDIIISLYKVDVLKFGCFKMKVGIDSPVYFDLRSVVAYPAIMQKIAMLLWEFAREDGECDQLCGVPYAALPIATLISVESNIPMVIRRKEAKKYGTKKLIEGKFSQGQKCIIIEDVVTSGSSILETINDLKSEGLDVTCALVIVDREQGGRANLAEKGIKMRSLCTLSQILNVLHEAGHINQEMVESVRKYIAASQIRPDGTFIEPQIQRDVAESNRLAMSFGARAKMATNPVAAKLLRIMETKQSNLCVAADVTNPEKLLSLARNIGPQICVFKTHIDIVKDFKPSIYEELCQLAQQHNFIIMEDRKFADIGHTVSQQYSEGIFNISSWADLVTVHPVPGEGVINGLKSVVENKERGCFLVAEMSSSGNLNTPNYVGWREDVHQKHGAGRPQSARDDVHVNAVRALLEAHRCWTCIELAREVGVAPACMEMCEKHKDFVVGVVCQTPSLIHSPGQIQLTPGVKLDSGNDGSLGQQYNTPDSVVLSRGADIAVVGRGITQAADPLQASKEYRSKLWAAYLKRIGSSEKA
ncbi:Uridine 5'-monophosphate synthase [Blattella germanica]|nr:Uridine 5'-monophosphate synthase [Blattella germanica]